MNSSFYIVAFLFIISMAVGYAALKYLEKRLGLIRIQSDHEEEEITRPPVFNRMDDIDYIVDWFIRRDKKIDNSFLLTNSIIDNLVEETKVEIDMFISQKLKFNRYLGDLIDFLPKVSETEKMMAENGVENYSLANIRNYIIAKIRILGWLYYCLYKKWYNQKDSEYLDFTEYYLLEIEEKGNKE